MTDLQSSVVVGVTPNQPDAVVRAAARFARHFDAELVCAYVVTGNYAVEELPDGSVRSLPVDADSEDWDEGVFDTGLLARLPEILGPRNVRWSTRTLAGDPAQALAHLADRLDASMIVIGSHGGGLRQGLGAFFKATVSAHLAHRQHRPVVIIPLDPVGADDPLPWESR